MNSIASTSSPQIKQTTQGSTNVLSNISGQRLDGKEMRNSLSVSTFASFKNRSCTETMRTPTSKRSKGAKSPLATPKSTGMPKALGRLLFTDQSSNIPISNIDVCDRINEERCTNMQNNHSPVGLSPASVIVGKKIAVSELLSGTPITSSDTSCKIQNKNRCDLTHDFNYMAAHISSNFTISNLPSVSNTPINQRQYLRRQQSASAALVSSRHFGCAAASTIARFTPPPSKEISSPIYAASKFCESPAAKSLPMPPLEWVLDLETRLECERNNCRLNVGEEDADIEHNNPKRSLFFLGSTNCLEEYNLKSTKDLKQSKVLPLEHRLCSESSDNSRIESTTAASESADTMSSGYCEGVSDSENSIDGEHTKLNKPMLYTGKDSGNGVRINPFALIAAVSSSF